jgi:glycosyltransferase involved in cell wall biosynthesis
MPVYRPIVPYLQRLGVTRYEVCYNSLNPTNLRKKDDYRLHDPVRILSVGRQFAEKNPDNLIRAVAQFGNVRLTLVGDGTHHAHLRRVAEQSGCRDRVEFVPSMPNDELCRRLPEFDIFATHSEYWEISKSVLEPLLTGLPVVINRRRGAPVPELTDDICLLVDNTAESYRQALERLITDAGFRERLGRSAYAHAQAHWSPAVTEAKFVAIYRRFLAAGEPVTTVAQQC